MPEQADPKRTQLFESTPIPRAVMTLSVPTVLSTLVMVLYNLADTWFVGLLNDPVQNSAVTLAAPVLLAFNAAINLFGVGASSMMSRALGRKDMQTVQESSALGFYGALLTALLFSVGCTVFRTPLLTLLGADADTAAGTGAYLFWTVTLGAAPAILNVVVANLVRAEGASLHAGIGIMSGCLLNIALDPLFILPQGLGMGAAGAGCATFLSNCAALVYFFVLLFVRRGNTCVCISPSRLRLRRAVVGGVCAVGVPAAIQNLLNVTGMTVLNNFTSAFGPDAVAAMGISHKISMIPMYIAMGLSQGIMPLVSYNFASGDRKRMKKAILFALAVSQGFLLCVTAGYYLGSRQLAVLFIKTPAVVDYSAAFLRGMCLGIPFLSLDFLAVGVFQACGMGGKSLAFAILRKLVLEIPALFILNRLFPLYGLAYAQPAAEVVLAAAAAVMLIHILREQPAPPPAKTE